MLCVVFSPAAAKLAAAKYGTENTILLFTIRGDCFLED